MIPPPVANPTSTPAAAPAWVVHSRGPAMACNKNMVKTATRRPAINPSTVPRTRSLFVNPEGGRVSFRPEARRWVVAFSRIRAVARQSPAACRARPRTAPGTGAAPQRVGVPRQMRPIHRAPRALLIRTRSPRSVRSRPPARLRARLLLMRANDAGASPQRFVDCVRVGEQLGHIGSEQHDVCARGIALGVLAAGGPAEIVLRPQAIRGAAFSVLSACVRHSFALDRSGFLK